MSGAVALRYPLLILVSGVDKSCGLLKDQLSLPPLAQRSGGFAVKLSVFVASRSVIVSNLIHGTMLLDIHVISRRQCVRCQGYQSDYDSKPPRTISLVGSLWQSLDIFTSTTAANHLAVSPFLEIPQNRS